MKSMKTTVLMLTAFSMLAGAAIGQAQETKSAGKTVKKKIKILKLGKDIEMDEFNLEDLAGLELEDADISELMNLDDVNVKIIKLDDGTTKVIVKSEAEETVTSDAKEKHVVIKRLRSEAEAEDDEKMTMKWIQTEDQKGPHHIDVGEDMNVEITEDGDVKVFKNGKLLSHGKRGKMMNIDKTVEKVDGKTKTRIVIEMETED